MNPLFRLFLILAVATSLLCSGTLPSFAQVSPPKIELSVPNDSGADKVEALVWTPAASIQSPQTAIVFVTGIDGGFIEPVDGIYTRVAEEMAQKGVLSIFVTYRYPGDLGSSVQDALSACRYALNSGATKLAIVGWSFGGAVIINTAVQVPEITTVIGIAPQSLDTEAVQQFTHQSLLLIHSDADENVPFDSSEIIMSEAPETIHKEFVPLSGANHYLTGMIDQVDPVINNWLGRELGLLATLR